jgi:hypothetical protein
MHESRKEEMRQQVLEYHQKHPEVWDLLVRFTFEVIEKGYKHYSINAIFERIRWEMDVGGDGVTTFKIGNNYRAFYARAFMGKYPQYEGFFRTRKQTSEDRNPTNKPEVSPADLEGGLLLTGHM